jgi:hypothetical protein
MEDLMVLCYYHHRAIEDAISKGEVPRKGNLDEIVSKTFFALQSYGKKLKNLGADQRYGRAETDRVNRVRVDNSRTPSSILKEEWFIEAMKLNRSDFKNTLRTKLQGCMNKASLIGHGCAVYDKSKNQRRKQRSIRKRESESSCGSAQTGFPPIPEVEDNCIDGVVVLTKELIVKTMKNGGFTPVTARALGLCYPLKKGWMKSLLGKTISIEGYRRASFGRNTYVCNKTLPPAKEKSASECFKVASA